MSCENIQENDACFLKKTKSPIGASRGILRFKELSTGVKKVSENKLVAAAGKKIRF